MELSLFANTEVRGVAAGRSRAGKWLAISALANLACGCIRMPRQPIRFASSSAKSRFSQIQEFPMSEQQKTHSDGAADAFAAIAVITIVVVTAVFWLSNLG